MQSAKALRQEFWYFQMSKEASIVRAQTAKSRGVGGEVRELMGGGTGTAGTLQATAAFILRRELTALNAGCPRQRSGPLISAPPAPCVKHRAFT